MDSCMVVPAAVVEDCARELERHGPLSERVLEAISSLRHVPKKIGKGAWLANKKIPDCDKLVEQVVLQENPNLSRNERSFVCLNTLEPFGVDFRQDSLQTRLFGERFSNRITIWSKKFSKLMFLGYSIGIACALLSYFPNFKFLAYGTVLTVPGGLSVSLKTSWKLTKMHFKSFHTSYLIWNLFGMIVAQWILYDSSWETKFVLLSCIPCWHLTAFFDALPVTVKPLIGVGILLGLLVNIVVLVSVYFDFASLSNYQTDKEWFAFVKGRLYTFMLNVMAFQFRALLTAARKVKSCFVLLTAPMKTVMVSKDVAKQLQDFIQKDGNKKRRTVLRIPGTAAKELDHTYASSVQLETPEVPVGWFLHYLREIQADTPKGSALWKVVSRWISEYQTPLDEGGSSFEESSRSGSVTFSSRKKSSTYVFYSSTSPFEVDFRDQNLIKVIFGQKIGNSFDLFMRSRGVTPILVIAHTTGIICAMLSFFHFGKDLRYLSFLMVPGVFTVVVFTNVHLGKKSLFTFDGMYALVNHVGYIACVFMFIRKSEAACIAFAMLCPTPLFVPLVDAFSPRVKKNAMVPITLSLLGMFLVWLGLQLDWFGLKEGEENFQDLSLVNSFHSFLFNSMVFEVRALFALEVSKGSQMISLRSPIEYTRIQSRQKPDEGFLSRIFSKSFKHHSVTPAPAETNPSSSALVITPSSHSKE